MKPLHWRPLALEDVEHAADRYGDRGGSPLALSFIEALEAATDLIARHPGSGSTRHAALFQDLPAPLRFVPLRTFDRYLVYSLDLPDYVDIIRVWDAARDAPDLPGESA